MWWLRELEQLPCHRCNVGQNSLPNLPGYRVPTYMLRVKGRRYGVPLDDLWCPVTQLCAPFLALDVHLQILPIYFLLETVFDQDLVYY